MTTKKTLVTTKKTPKKPKAARKRPRKTEKAQEAGPNSAELLDSSIGELRVGLEALSECLRAARREVQGSKTYDSTKGSHVAWLVQQQSGITRELRQLEKHNRELLAKITPEQRYENVLAYLEHDMPAARRRDVRELLDRLDQEEGLLG